jgi:hypothetical protein
MLWFKRHCHCRSAALREGQVRRPRWQRRLPQGANTLIPSLPIEMRAGCTALRSTALRHSFLLCLDTGNPALMSVPDITSHCALSYLRTCRYRIVLFGVLQFGVSIAPSLCLYCTLLHYNTALCTALETQEEWPGESFEQLQSTCGSLYPTSLMWQVCIANRISLL